MKKHLFLVAYFCTYLFGDAIALTPEQEAYIREKKTITMCADPDWAPFEVINDKKEPTVLEIVDIAFDSVNTSKLEKFFKLIE